MEFTKEPNYPEDFEHESRAIQYKVNSDRPELLGEVEDESQPIPLPAKTVRI